MLVRPSPATHGRNTLFSGVGGVVGPADLPWRRRTRAAATRSCSGADKTYTRVVLEFGRACASTLSITPPAISQNQGSTHSLNVDLAVPDKRGKSVCFVADALCEGFGRARHWLGAGGQHALLEIG